MKNTLLVLSALIAILAFGFLVSCAPEAETKEVIKEVPNGFYQGSGVGFNSRAQERGYDIVLGVNIVNSTVAGYTVLKHNESTGTGFGWGVTPHANRTITGGSFPSIGDTWPSLEALFIGRPLPLTVGPNSDIGGTNPSGGPDTRKPNTLAAASDVVVGATYSWTGFSRALNDAFDASFAPSPSFDDGVWVYPDGTYSGTAVGRANSDGLLEVDVTIANGAITNIVYTTNTETGYNLATGNYFAIDDQDAMKNKIIAAQDWKVDVESGATVSSQAVSAAVADALEQSYKTNSGTFKNGVYTGQGVYSGTGGGTAAITVDASVTISGGVISAVALTVSNGTAAVVDSTLEAAFVTANSSYPAVAVTSGNRYGLRVASLAVADALRKAAVASAPASVPGTYVGIGSGYNSNPPTVGYKNIILNVKFDGTTVKEYTVVSNGESNGQLDGSTANDHGQVGTRWPTLKTVFVGKTVPIAVVSNPVDRGEHAPAAANTTAAGLDGVSGATFSWTGFANAINEAYANSQ